MEIDGRELDALSAILDELRLDPESSYALMRVTEAMDNVPGEDIKDELFIHADEVIEQYPDAAFRPRQQKTIVWHMPGHKGWTGKEGLLPIPPFDRLVHRQAVAVAVSPNTLVVDKELAGDALAAYILIDEDTVVPATVVEPRSSRDYIPQFTFIRTQEAVFQPVSTDAEAKPEAGQLVATCGLGIFTEMGTQTRRIVTEITGVADDGTIELGASLSAGEAAAPVLTEKRQLVGFLAGRTDVLKDNGGEDVLIPLTDMTELIEQAQRRSTHSSSQLKRQFEPIETDAAFFIVYCIAGETLE